MRAVLGGKLWARDEAQRWRVLEEAVGKRTGGGAPEQRPAEFRPLEVRGAQEKAEVGEAKGNGSQMKGATARVCPCLEISRALTSALFFTPGMFPMTGAGSGTRQGQKARTVEW